MSSIIQELDVPPRTLRWLATGCPERYPVLLESAVAGPLSAYSILLGSPRAALWLDRDGRLGAEGMTPASNDFLTALERWWLLEGAPGRRLDNLTVRAPFRGGWAIFLSYEIAAQIEPKLRLPPSSLPWQAFALRTPCALIHELSSGRVYAVGEPDAAERVKRLVADARHVARQGEPASHSVMADAVVEEAEEAYLERVVRAKEYIQAGDIYQANLSRPWRIELTHEPDAGTLYERLCRANPAPFAALSQWRGLRILSSSPERLLRVEDGRVQTRPIAGTRPRSPGRDHDLQEIHALAAHPKERAEHIMLIDLERNDLGRVCRPGSVRVDELMSIESYAHVHHIVSNVTGRLREDVTPIAALRAVFPGGTITGCPKVRCMQLIAMLEGEARGAYTGSLGFLGCDGTMDLNILIRTMTLSGRVLELRAGAGIVADSDPRRELEETRAKAKGLLAAVDRKRHTTSTA